jgi:N-acetylglucosamine-6-phosphate deacetylase
MKSFTGSLSAKHYQTGQPYSFRFEKGRLISKTATPASRTNTANLPLFGPGFCDIQVNGFAGCDFNHPNTTQQDLLVALSHLKETGCTVVLPTLITAPLESLEAHFATLASLPERLSDGTQIPGFHLEGPFISPQDGARGAHPLDAVRPADTSSFRQLQRAARNRIAMVTLAPESHGTIPLIKFLSSKKILSAIGHTMADHDAIQKAMRAGARLSTHLGNGCPGLLDRHRNPVIAQLAEPDLGASFIPDGIHLPPPAFRALWTAKAAAPRILTTDCMAAAHAKPGRYTIGKVTTEVGTDGIVRLPGSNVFAGSAITMNRAVPLAAAMARIPLWQAWDAASRIPLRLLANSHIGRINPGTLFAKVRSNTLQILHVLHGKTLHSL